MEEENFFEENVTNKDLRSNNKFVKILIFIIIICILGFGVYLTYLKLNEKEEVKEEQDEEKDVIVEGISLDCTKECSYPIEFTNSEATLKYVVSGDDTSSHKLFLNDKELLDLELTCGGIHLLTVLDDIFIVSYNENCKSTGNNLVLYDKDGNLLKSYNYAFDTYNMWIDTTSYDVINKKIKFSATRLYKGHILHLTKEKEVNLCEDDEYDLYGIDINTPISGTYSIEYLGNNMFSNLEFTPNKLVKDDILTCEE